MERADIRAQLSEAQRRELDAWETFGVLIALTRQFNREAASLASAARGASRIAQSFEYLFDDPDLPASEQGDTKQVDVYRLVFLNCAGRMRPRELHGVGDDRRTAINHLATVGQ